MKRQLWIGPTLAVGLMLVGCGENSSGDDRLERAADAARVYQEHVLAQDRDAICKAESARLRGGTHSECVERLKDAPARDSGTKVGAVTTGDPVEVPASGDHPAGVGVPVSYDYDHGNGDGPTTDHQAVRVIDEDDQWQVDQAENLDSAGDAAAVRTALQER